MNYVCKGLRGKIGYSGVSPELQNIELIREGNDTVIILYMSIGTIKLNPVLISKCCIPNSVSVAYNNNKFLSSIDVDQIEIVSGNNNVILRGSNNHYCFIIETNISPITVIPNVNDAVSASYNRLDFGFNPELFIDVNMQNPLQFGVLLNKFTLNPNTLQIINMSSQDTNNIIFTNISDRQYGGFRRTETISNTNSFFAVFNNSVNLGISSIVSPPFFITQYLQNYDRIVEQELWFHSNSNVNIKINSNNIEEVNEVVSNTKFYRLNKYIINAGNQMVPTTFEINLSELSNIEYKYFIFMYSCV